MASLAPHRDLWTLVTGNPSIDPGDLAQAVVAELERDSHDTRTRMLIRESVEALRERGGAHADFQPSLSPRAIDALNSILHEEFDKIGFPGLRTRLMEKTNLQRAY